MKPLQKAEICSAAWLSLELSFHRLLKDWIEL